MEYLPGIFALLVAAAGWFYLFYSRAAAKLTGVEEDRPNRLRIGLRRANGIVMILLAVAFYAGYYTTAPNSPWWAFCWLSVLVLLAAILILAMIDLHLTRKFWQARRDLRRELRQGPPREAGHESPRDAARQTTHDSHRHDGGPR